MMSPTEKELVDRDRRDASTTGRSLSAQLLILTIGFVMLAEVLIYVPSISRFRSVYLEERLAAGELASLALEATPNQVVGPDLARELLRHAEARAVVIKGPRTRNLILADDMPVIHATYDLRGTMWPMLIRDTFVALWPGPSRTLRVVGESRRNPEIVIEVVLDDAPLIDAMYDFSWRILRLSLIISFVTATLVFLSLQWMLVRPMRRFTRSMVRFRLDPEDPGTTMVPSGRRDEIGVAQQELAQMQVDLRNALHQRSRLATLGTAVGKISHDLRNILATAQLVSDRIAASNDPDVRRVTPTLMRAIDRAVDLCSNTVSFVSYAEGKVFRRRLDLRDVVEDVGLSMDLSAESEVAWRNDVPEGFNVFADREQLFRALLNIGRNSMQAIESCGDAGRGSIRVSASRERELIRVDVEDSGPGVPAELRDKLFQPFAKSDRAGSTGLGLAIARDIAHAHGGDVSLVTSGESGSTFRLTIRDGATAN
jgi:signal transduction histidine kinase